MRRNGSSIATRGGRGPGRVAAIGLLSAACLGGVPAPLAAADAGSLDLAGYRTLSDAALDRLRGGFRFGPFDLAIGITVSTAIDNAVALRTSFQVVGRNRIHDIRSDVTGEMPGPPQAPEPPRPPSAPQQPQAPQPSHAPEPSPTPAPPGGGGPAGNPGGVAVASGGIEFTAPGTRILQQIDNGLLTEIVNAADGRSITHSTSIDLTVKNLSRVVSEVSARLRLNRLASEAAYMQSILGH